MTTGPLHPMKNLLLLWKDGRWNTVRSRVEPGHSRFAFLGAWFVVSIYTTKGGWPVCFESRGWIDAPA